MRERNGNRDLIFFKTEDGGTTFEKINLPYESFSKYFNIICSAKSTPKVEGFYLIAGYADDPVIVSYDYGNTWIDTYMPDFNTSAGVVRFKNSEYGFGVFSNRITKAKGYYYRDYRSLGVKEEVFNANTKIFPVPTTSEINVLGIENANYTIQDMSGRTIQNGFFEKSINVKELKQGVYILTISNDNQRYVKKIVKE